MGNYRFHDRIFFVAARFLTVKYYYFVLKFLIILELRRHATKSELIV